jgi:AmmeMemoRadiSam system protein A
MYIPRSFHTTLVLETLIDHFSGSKNISLSIDDLPDEFSEPAACFVSINDPTGTMRGCMGSISPNKQNLYDEIISNTRHAAFNDKRFSPLQKHELEDISITVEIIGPMVKVSSLENLDPEKYGIMVKDRQGKMGVLLPMAEQKITAEQQLKIACKKGGIKMEEVDELDIYKYKIKAYK